MKPRISIFALAGALFLGALFAFSKLQAEIYEPSQSLKISEKDISLIVVDNSATRTRGLSGMKSLPEDQAMLFVFDESDSYGIWMKDMNFPIDIFWLNESFTVVHIEKSVSPDSYPTVFYPKEKSLYVLETNAGFAEKNDIFVGKVLEFVKKVR